MAQGQPNTSYPITTSSKVSSISPGDYAACDEGSFFVSTLAATASTALALSVQAGADTNPAVGIFNGQPAGGYNIYLRYIKVQVTVVAGSNSFVNYSSLVDNILVKLTTAGTALGTPANTNTGSGVLSKMTGNAGVNIAAAQSASGRRVGAGQIEGNLNVALDEWIFYFGPPAAGGDVNGTVTNPKRITVYHAPVILAPQWWYTLGFWGTAGAASAATYAWEIGFIERPSGL